MIWPNGFSRWSIVSRNTLTVERAQEGTTARAFDVGNHSDIRWGGCVERI